jgi:hypothetical protein
MPAKKKPGGPKVTAKGSKLNVKSRPGGVAKGVTVAGKRIGSAMRAAQRRQQGRRDSR